MNTSDTNPTANDSGSSSDTPATRRRRLPGAESGFGRRLREARGIETQQDVADRAEVARSAYARYETGARYPSVPELRRLCDALSVSPEHLIFGASGTGYKPNPSPIAEIAPDGDSEKDRITRHVLTGVLLNALPKNEGDAFRELIWASASRYLHDQPEALEAITRICGALTESMWEDMDALVEDRLRSDPNLKEIVNALSDSEETGP